MGKQDNPASVRDILIDYRWRIVLGQGKRLEKIT